MAETSSTILAKDTRSGEKRYTDQAQLTGKFLIRGILKTESPLMIGCGKSDLSGIDILLDKKEHRPFIPGSSLAGVVRHALLDFCNQEDVSRLFGLSYEETQSVTDKTQMSQIYFGDAYVTGDYTVRVRDSVRINSRTAAASDQGKFDYEVIESGAEFPIGIEVSIRKSIESSFVIGMCRLIFSLFDSQHIRIGAKTNAGFGRFNLKKFSYMYLDFKKPQDVKTWLTRSYDNDFHAGWLTTFPDSGKQEDKSIREKGNDSFLFQGIFSISNSLMVRSYDQLEGYENCDAVMMTAGSDETAIIPGPSLRGAFRHHAEKIFNTFHPGHKKQFEQMFGIVETDFDSNTTVEKTRKIKSKIRVEEQRVENQLSKLLTRNRINRFTGGTLETALFSIAPLWGGGSGAIHLEISAKCLDRWEAGLLVLTIKDFWFGVAAVGGNQSIGSGFLSGQTGKLRYNGKTINLKEKDKELQLTSEDDSFDPEEFLDLLIETFHLGCAGSFLTEPPTEI